LNDALRIGFDVTHRVVMTLPARLESTRAQAAFARFGIYDVLPKDHIFHSVDQAIHALAKKA